MAKCDRPFRRLYGHALPVYVSREYAIELNELLIGARALKTQLIEQPKSRLGTILGYAWRRGAWGSASLHRYTTMEIAGSRIALAIECNVCHGNRIGVR